MSVIVDKLDQSVFIETTELKIQSETDQLIHLVSQALTTVSISSASAPSLNQRLADSILKYVGEKIEIIPNYLEKLDFGKDAPSIDLVGIIGNLYEVAFSECDFETISFRSIQKIAQTAQRFKVGTCYELAAVGFDYAVNQKAIQRVEIFCIENGNHVFLVIGRDPKSDPKNFKTWGPAVICDPWRGKTYRADEKDAFVNFKSQDFIDGKFVTSLEPFDPKTQSLNLLLSNTN